MDDIGTLNNIAVHLAILPASENKRAILLFSEIMERPFRILGMDGEVVTWNHSVTREER